MDLLARRHSRWPPMAGIRLERRRFVASQWIDLHCHSTASDGTLSPADVVRLAVRSGLSAIALTDHDTIGGIAQAAAEAKNVGIDFLPGSHISAEYPHPGTMHILRYGVD